MKVQQFLYEYGVKGLRSIDVLVKEYKDLIILNYLQTGRDSDIARECRGLVLDKHFNIVSRGFDRFYNYTPESNFDFSNAVVMEKVDGSYGAFFYWKNRWFYQTRGTLGETECNGYTFKELLNLACNGDPLPALYDFPELQWYTIIFELVTPYNKVVKSYEDSAIYILGARNKETGEFIHPQKVYDKLKDIIPCRLPKFYDFKNYNAILEGFKDFDYLDEGVVCWNPNDNSTVKIKREEYVRVHHLATVKGFTTDEKFLEVLLENEQEEVLVYFPELKVRFSDLEEKFDTFIKFVQKTYDNIAGIEEQKAFALEAVKNPFSSVLFQMRKNGTSAKDELVKMPPEKLVKWM